MNQYEQDAWGISKETVATAIKVIKKLDLEQAAKVVCYLALEIVEHQTEQKRQNSIEDRIRHECWNEIRAAAKDLIQVEEERVSSDNIDEEAWRRWGLDDFGKQRHQ